MIKLQVEGNLGADAEVRRENGRVYVMFRVADTQRRTVGDKQTERTQWVSCFLNGDGGNLLQYLKKGARVYVSGDGDVNQYHSEQQRALVAGMTCFVRDIELVGGKPDAVPRELYDFDGVAHRVVKYFLTDVKSCKLYSRSQAEFNVDANGWVTPATPGITDANVAPSQEQSADTNHAPDDKQEKKTNSRKK